MALKVMNDYFTPVTAVNTLATIQEICMESHALISILKVSWTMSLNIYTEYV